jgi:hypothetical protein
MIKHAIPAVNSPRWSLNVGDVRYCPINRHICLDNCILYVYFYKQYCIWIKNMNIYYIKSIKFKTHVCNGVIPWHLVLQ